MDQIRLTPNELFMYSTIIGVIVGFVVGLVPLISGIFRKNLKLGLIGFVCSLIGGAILSLILALPVAGIFTWLILKGKTSQSL